MKKKFENKIIELLIFLNFNIRNVKITKYRSFYISSFQILTPTQLYQCGKLARRWLKFQTVKF